MPKPKKVIRFLLDQGELLAIGDDALVTRAAVAEMKQIIAAFIDANGSATVSQLRQTLGSSRRILVPLLELLDRTGFTRRVGDERKLASNR